MQFRNQINVNSKRIHKLVLPAMLALGGLPAVGQTLQSGEAGFGWQWVRSNPFSIQGLSENPLTWNISQYFGAGMTMLNRAEGTTYTLIRPAPYQNATWQSFLAVPEGGPVSSTETEFDELQTTSGNAGWIVGDEPSTIQMPYIAEVNSYIRQTDTSVPIYTTATNITATAAELYGNSSEPNYNYTDYLNDFISIMNPDILAYDYYPFESSGATGSQYMQNLMAVRTAAQANGLPYWGWVQSFGDVSESDNRYNVYTLLTAGYTGLLYWTYDYYSSTGNGLIDENGDPTALYSEAATTNEQAVIVGGAERFLNSTAVCFVPGYANSKVLNSTPVGLTNWVAGAGGDPYITGFSDTNIGSNDNGLIGLFTDTNGEHYFMLTNLNHSASLSAAAATLSFTLSFNSSINTLWLLNSTTGQQQEIALTNNQLDLTLPGGTGDLFRYNNNSIWMAQSGDWQDADNWGGWIPNGADEVADFNGSITAPRSIYTNVATTVGGLSFNSSNTYVIGGAGSLAMQVSTGAAAINVLSGSHTINLPLTFVSNTNIGIANGSTLTIGNPTTIDAGTTVTVNGNLLIEAPLSIQPGGSLVMNAAPAVTLLGAPSLGAGAKIDIGSSAVTFDYTGSGTPAATIAALLASGYNNGAWNGAGIDSSSAAAHPGYALGYADGADGIVSGLHSGQIEVEYTLYGDANLDGIVDASDLAILAANFGRTVTGWDQGDFDYGGIVNGSDFALLAANFGKSSSGAAVTLPSSEWAALDAFASANGLVADVPEPSSLGLLALAGCFARRRRAARRVQ